MRGITVITVLVAFFVVTSHAFDGAVFEATMNHFVVPQAFRWKLIEVLSGTDADVVLDDEAQVMPRFFASNVLMVHFHLKADTERQVRAAEDVIATMGPLRWALEFQISKLELLNFPTSLGKRHSTKFHALSALQGDGSGSGSGAIAPYMIPAWDNIRFTAVFPSHFDAATFPAKLSVWCTKQPVCAPPVFSPFSADSVMQTWMFAANTSQVPPLNFSAIAAVAHRFAALDSLEEFFNINRLTGVAVLPPSSIPAGDNIAFNFEFEFPANVTDLKANLALLLGVPTTSFNISVQVLTPTKVAFHFDGNNAVTLADNLEAVPITVLFQALGVTTKQPSQPILPPPPSESSSKVKWFLIGIGVVVVAAAVPLVWFVRRRRARRLDDGMGDDGYSHWDRGSRSNGINDRDAYAKLR